MQATDSPVGQNLATVAAAKNCDLVPAAAVALTEQRSVCSTCPKLATLGRLSC